MVAEPGAIAVTTPVAPTVAIAVLLLVQVPPDVASESVVLAPLHNTLEPVMAAGMLYTVTRAVDTQPDMGM